MGKDKGRPTKYKPEFNELAYNYCLLGATDQDLAEFFKVCEATINVWKHEYPEFMESITRGKVIADMEVSKSLFKIANGFEYEETTTGVGDKGGINITNRRYATPDFKAIRFWLMNRQSKKWRDKVEEPVTTVPKIEVSFTDGNNETGK